MKHPIAVLFIIALVIAGCAGRSSGELPPTDASTTDTSTTNSPEDSQPEAVVFPPNDSPPPLPSPEQKIMFEISFVNFARNRTISGVYITSDGSVFRYDYKLDPQAPIPYTKLTHSMTEAQVTEKHGPNLKRIATVDLQELQTQWGRSFVAANGALLTSSSCRDYGVLRYVAYHYNEQLKTYSAVLLKGIGDAAIKNTNPVADQLVVWMQTVAEYSPSEACGYDDSMANCDVSPCDGAPKCQSGKLLGQRPPSSCANTCVWPTNCTHVKDCSDCGNDACVIDLEGKRHCNSMSSCEKKPWKDCQCDDTVCAGGIEYCTKQQSGELICHAKLVD